MTVLIYRYVCIQTIAFYAILILNIIIFMTYKVIPRPKSVRESFPTSKLSNRRTSQSPPNFYVKFKF